MTTLRNGSLSEMQKKFLKGIPVKYDPQEKMLEAAM